MVRRVLKRAANIAFKIVGRGKGVTIGRHSDFLYYKLHTRKGCHILIGNDCDINSRISFDREGAKVKIGDRCYIGASHLVCADCINIGDDVIISWGVTIVDHNSHALDWNARSRDVAEWKTGKKDWSNVRTERVVIGDKVWIGFNASILKGVTIGEGAMVAAGAMVTHDVEPYTAVAGNPARSLGKIVGNSIERAD